MADERVIPGVTDVYNLEKHVARYNLALSECVKKKVLDVSCGTGYGTWLLSQVASTVIGVDIDNDTVLHAKKKYSLDNNYFVVGDAQKLHITNIDVVISFETIEHLDDVSAFVENVKNVDTIVFSVPLNETPGWNEHHKQIYTLETARQIFPDRKIKIDLIQQDVNFYEPELVMPGQFQYYFCVATL